MPGIQGDDHLLAFQSSVVVPATITGVARQEAEVLGLSERSAKYDMVLTVGFFGAIAFFFSRPLYVVTDFWWHLSSGRWMVEHQALPQMDPFALFPEASPGLRETLILKGYWLAQVLFFEVHDLAGASGLVVFKIVLLTAIVFCAWRFLTVKGVPSPWSLLLLVPLVVFLREYDELRPQLFSFLGLAAIVLLLDATLARLENTGRAGLPAISMVVAMLLWANLHPGFIVGSGVVILFLVAEGTRYRMGGSRLSARGLSIYCAVGLASVLVTIANPNGIGAYRLLLAENIGGNFAGSISEYDSLKEYFSRTDELYLFYGMLFLVLIAVLSCFISKKKKNYANISLLLIFCLAGFGHFRYAAFLLLMAIFVIGEHFNLSILSVKRTPILLGKFAVLFAGVFFVVNTYAASAFSQGALFLDSVDKTVAFVENRALPGPLFLPYEWSGYIQWALFPKYRTFIDPRTLDYVKYAEYREAVSGKKAKIFEKYGFKTVIFYLYPPYLERIPSIIYTLLKDNEWKLLYQDANSLVFSLATSDGYVGEISKVEFISFLEKRLLTRFGTNQQNIYPLLDLGQLSYVKNDLTGARYYFSKALELNSRDEFALTWLKYLESARQ